MDHYEFLHRVAEGAYGSVWACKDRTTGRVVAVKKMKDATPAGGEAGSFVLACSPRPGFTPVAQEYEFALREVQLLQLLQHRNVVQLLEAYQSTSGRLYLVFEYVDFTLLGLLKAAPSGRGLPSPQIKSIMWQLLQSLTYMHGKKVIHRDIKPSNILVTSTGVVKLCDFGFARPLDSAAPVADYTTYVVTRWYRAPEVLIGDAYGSAVDIWSFGCIFAELITGRALFPGRNNNDQLWLVLTSVGRLTDSQMRILQTAPQFASFRLPLSHEYVKLEQRLKDVPRSVLQLLNGCLNPDPAKRMTAEQLMQLPYWNGVEDVLPPDYWEGSPSELVDTGRTAEGSMAAEADAAPRSQPEPATSREGQWQQQQREREQLRQQQQLQQQQAREQQQSQQLKQQQQALSQQQPQQQRLDVSERTKAAIAVATAAVAAAAESAAREYSSPFRNGGGGSDPRARQHLDLSSKQVSARMVVPDLLAGVSGASPESSTNLVTDVQLDRLSDPTGRLRPELLLDAPPRALRPLSSGAGEAAAAARPRSTAAQAQPQPGPAQAQQNQQEHRQQQQQRQQQKQQTHHHHRQQSDDSPAWFPSIVAGPSANGSGSGDPNLAYVTAAELVGTLRRSVTAPEEDLKQTAIAMAAAAVTAQQGPAAAAAGPSGAAAVAVGSAGAEPAATARVFKQRISEPSAGAPPGGSKALQQQQRAQAYLLADTPTLKPQLSEPPRPRQQQQQQQSGSQQQSLQQFPPAVQPQASQQQLATAKGSGQVAIPRHGSGAALAPLSATYAEEGAAPGKASSTQPYQYHSGNRSHTQVLAISPSGSSESQLSSEEPSLHLPAAGRGTADGSAAGAGPSAAVGSGGGTESRRSSSDCGTVAGLLGPSAVLAPQHSATAVSAIPLTPPKHSPNDGRRQSDSAAGLASNGQQRHLTHKAAAVAAAAAAAASAAAAQAAAAAAAAAAAQQLGGSRRFRKAQSIDGQCLFPGEKTDASWRAFQQAAHNAVPPDAPPGTILAPGSTAWLTHVPGQALPPLHAFALLPGAAATAAAAAAAAAPAAGGQPASSASSAPSSTELAPSRNTASKVPQFTSEHLPTIRGTLPGVLSGSGTAVAAVPAPNVPAGRITSAARTNGLAPRLSAPSPAPAQAPPSATGQQQLSVLLPPQQQLSQQSLALSPSRSKPYLPTLPRTNPVKAPEPDRANSSNNARRKLPVNGRKAS